MNSFLASKLAALSPIQEPEPEPDDFISSYLQYTSETECPTFFHRWTAITCLSAWLGRRVHFPFGHFKIHANMYVMLIGKAGTKKSTAVKIGAHLLEEAGYDKFAADKIRQEKFLIDLAEGDDESEPDDILDTNLFGDSDKLLEPVECFVAADEINNFIGVGNLEFMSILGELWDINKVFEYRLKNSKSVKIPYPTISILAGNTFVGFNRLFPPEAIEQGFFSRMLFVYGEPTGVKYTIPKPPNEEIKQKLVAKLNEIKDKVKGEMTLTDDAYKLLDKIYKEDFHMDDVRFEAYEQRRLQHLLKICMIIAASRVSNIIDESCIVEANTLLTFTEHLMPKALGEFGRAKNSSCTHIVMSIIDEAKVPISLQQIWQKVHHEFEGVKQLADVLSNLQVAEKIQSVTGGAGYLPIKKVRGKNITGAVNWDLLTKEERGFI